MTRTAILSDIHGNLLALEACVADAEAQGCTAFANLGDILSGPLWPRETANWLMERDWPTIRGNHERYVLNTSAEGAGQSDLFTRETLDQRHLDWLAAIPVTMELGEGIYCTHARPGCDYKYLLESVSEDGLFPAREFEIIERLGEVDAPLILHGHSHLQRDVTLESGVGGKRQRIVNPGSVGLPAFFDNHPHDHKVECGSPDARYAIMDGDDIELRCVAYDHEAAAKKAEEEGADDWVHHLRTGLAR